MATGYTRQSAASITSAATVTSAAHNNEYNQLQSAFDATTGHNHDGTAGGGALIPLATGTTGTLAVANGGTAGTTAAAARTNLGLGSIATQAASAVAITGGTVTGVTDIAVADGGTGASTAADARTNLGLGTIATQAASAVTITGGAISGITDIAVADGGTGASTAATARSNLGAGGLTDNNTWTGTQNFSDAVVSRPVIKDYGETINALGTGSGTLTLNMELGNIHTATINGTTTLAFSNWPTSGVAGSATLFLTNAGGFTFNLAATCRTASNGGLGTLTTSGTDIITFVTLDGGANVHTAVSTRDSR